MPRFVAVGEIMLDVSAPAGVPGHTLHAPLCVRAGGSAVTAARWAAAAGADAAVVGRIGADAVGGLVRGAIVADGVEPRLAVDRDLPTGTFVECGSGAARAVVVERGANRALSPDDLGQLEADALLVSGFVLLHADVAAAGEQALARTTAAWRAVDLGSAHLVGRRSVSSSANALFANEDEARAFTGRDSERAVGALADRFRLVCVKRGRLGAILAVDGRQVRVPGEPLTEPLAGAGDALAGTLLSALAAGNDPEAALELACGVAIRAATSPAPPRLSP